MRRVLIVEDFPAYRRFICSTLVESFDLCHRRSFRWIRSGTESGRAKTRFDFARHRTPHHEWNRGRSTDSQAFPKIQIIFLSQETSADVVEEALSTGACSYVVKTKAASQRWCRKSRGLRERGLLTAFGPSVISFLTRFNLQG